MFNYVNLILDSNEIVVHSIYFHFRLSPFLLNHPLSPTVLGARASQLPFPRNAGNRFPLCVCLAAQSTVVPTAVAASPGSMLEMHGLGPCPKSESAFSKDPSGCSWVHQIVKYCIWGLSRHQVIFLNMAGPSSRGPPWAANLAKANSSCFLASCSYSCLISIGLGDICPLATQDLFLPCCQPQLKGPLWE